MYQFTKTLIISFLLFFIALPASAQEPLIKIGVSLGLTGKYSEMSDMQMKGFRLWESDVNKRGGLLGKKVQVIIYDDKSDPHTAKSAYEYLILKDKVDFVFRPYSSGITEAILPVTEEHGYPVLATGASADSIWQKGYKNVFGIYAPASKYSLGFLELLVRNNFKNVAIVHADDAFSRDLAQGTKKWAERFGLNVLLFEGFKKDAENLVWVAAKAKAVKAQALIVCGHFNEAVNIRLAFKRIKWQPKAYFASVGPALSSFHAKLGADAEYVFSSSQWEHIESRKNPGCHEFYTAYIEAYNETPSYHAATAYAGGQILETAIIKAKSIEREKIRVILLSMDALNIIGRYGVDKRGMQVKHFNFIIQWQDGKKKTVWPEELKTSDPIFR